MKTIIVTVVFVLLNCLILSGQEKVTTSEKNKVEKLGGEDLSFRDDSVEMNVISASRSSKRIGELPITIYVVTREEIIRNHYNSLIDVIKSLPGVRVSQPGSGELGESFQLRGLIGNLYTMILINGLPIKPSAVIGMPVLSQLPIQEAERIEVIYGPAAAVYGADAVSGVINIITKEADKGTFVMGDISLGQFDYRSSNFMVGGKTGKNKNVMQYSFYVGLSEVSDLNIKTGYQDVYNPLHYLQNSGKTFTVGSTTYEPIQLTDKILRAGGVDPADFIDDNYPTNYKGTLTLPAIEDLPASSNMLGFQLRYRDISLSFNNMYRRSHSSPGQSSYLFKYNNPQNFWGENIRSTTLSYNHEWTPKFTTTTNFSDLIYKMDNNSSLGVSFIDNTDKVYRYAAGNDILFEQLFTVMLIKFELADEEIKGLEIKTLKAESSRKENELKLLMKERELDRSEKDRLAQSLVLEQEKNQLRENEQKVRSLEQQQEIQKLTIKQKDDEALVLQKTNESLEKDKILKETELKNEKFARKMAVWLGALMVLVAGIILFSLISSRKKNQKLAESKKQIEKINSDLEIKNTEVLRQNEKILQQKDIIEQKNQSITDSIQYASRIQTVVLPPIDFLSEWGIENFILYKPKDIVSGDFYWGLKKDEKIIVAAGDCTGHGVPGAFMSMLGHAFLDEIVNTTKVENAAMILNLLRDEIINTLKQKGMVGEARDGMDMPISLAVQKVKNICINHSRICFFAIIISQWIFRKRYLITHLKNGKASASRLTMFLLSVFIFNKAKGKSKK